MTQHSAYDAVVVGSGPNGLAAAITLAQAGRSVLILEGKETIGGGARTAELTLPGYLHDICAAIHPLGAASPFFHSLPLAQHGLEWIHPDAPVAHPLDGGCAAMLERSLEATGETLGVDAESYRRLMAPFVENWQAIIQDFLGPLPIPPKHPWIDLQFSLKALQPARWLAERHFQGQEARALFAGMAGHSILPLEQVITASYGLVTAMLGHAVGWPMARGGSQRIVDALAAHLRSLGGQIETNCMVRSLDELPPARIVMLDITPRQFVQIAGERLPGRYRRQLERYRYGPGVFKIDYALQGPIPWAAPACSRAGTVHVGGTLAEIAAEEAAVWRGEHPDQPYVLVAQQSPFDPSRAPQGRHTAWAYCHVPHNSTIDMTSRIEAQIERFAPGFRDLILARHTRNTQELEAYNPNYVGGDIIGGVVDLWQLFTRPVARWVPYSTPLKGVYLCSSSTPPGGGVHGMCGYHAATAALRAEK